VLKVPNKMIACCGLRASIVDHDRVRKDEQPPWIVPDELWERIEPLLPRWENALPRLGRKRLPDRPVLQGILFVLHTGIQWEFLPQELGFGSGMTCWRRLAEWNEAGVWQRLHEALLAELNAAGKLDWSRAVIDSWHARAARRGPKAARARSTAPDQAPGITWSPRARASRWRPA
jgi:transposase